MFEWMVIVIIDCQVELFSLAFFIVYAVASKPKFYKILFKLSNEQTEIETKIKTSYSSLSFFPVVFNFF